jgi:hypothetical protein
MKQCQMKRAAERNRNQTAHMLRRRQVMKIVHPEKSGEPVAMVNVRFAPLQAGRLVGGGVVLTNYSLKPE